MTISEDIEKGTEKARKFWAALRQYLGLIVVVSGSVYGALEWWADKHPQTEPATMVEMTPRLDSLEAKIDAVDMRLTVYQDSLGRLYTFVDTAIAKPSLNMLGWALKRLDRMESLGAESRMDNLALKRQVSNSTIAVVAEMRRANTVDEKDELLRELLRELKSVKADNAQIKKKLKIADPYETR